MVGSEDFFCCVELGERASRGEGGGNRAQREGLLFGEKSKT